MRIAFYTLGCKVNQYETQILSQLFAAEGFDIVDCDTQADVYVINSCTVTSSGDKKTRQMLHKFHRLNPAAKLALTGCFPQAFPDISEKLPEADVITGVRNRKRLVSAVLSCLANGQRIIDITPHKKGESFEEMHATDFHERTRAFVKIEDGCERYCSYCIIPTARGPVRSKPLDDIQSEVSSLAAKGYHEIVLVGINLSCYGKDLGLHLLDACRTACSVEGIERVRLGSLEPELLTAPDIQAMAALKEMCPQFHLSLQSGCDATLRRMNRHYDTALYREIVGNLRKAFDNCAITTDIMVGFPGETEEEFHQSLDFCVSLGLAKAHVFAYSIREGTRAAVMENQVTKADKDTRSRRMIAATEQTRKLFLEQQVGLTCEVLFETGDQDHLYEGYTRNYTPVSLTSQTDLKGKLCMVKIISTDGSKCYGELAYPE